MAKLGTLWSLARCYHWEMMCGSCVQAIVVSLRGRGLTLPQLQQELQRMGPVKDPCVLDLRDNAVTSPPWFLGTVPGLVAVALQGNPDLPRELLEADRQGFSLQYLREGASRICGAMSIHHGGA